MIFAMVILLQIDLKTDYSNCEIPYHFHADNGFYINVPYFVWQVNKQRAIEQRYSETVAYEGKTYIVTSIFKDKPHLKDGAELLPSFLYRDFIATVELEAIYKNSTTNINQIIGNNNTISNNVIINQEKTQNIISNINLLLQTEIDDIDKQCLELFQYKLCENNVNENDKNRVLTVLEKLTKYAPYASLASSVINLIKALLP